MLSGAGRVRISREFCVSVVVCVAFAFRGGSCRWKEIPTSDGYRSNDDRTIGYNIGRSGANGNTGKGVMSLLLFLLGALLGPAEGHLSSGLLAISITRHHKGDVFVARGGKCYKDFCVSLSGGTAAPTGNGDCECKCAADRPVFRDDLNTCVDDIRECNLVSFASGSIIKKIPYVFLPLKGQIVYPSADIVMSEKETPVCVVSGGQFLGQSGWVNLRNHSGTETPFRLFRDEGRTYLQWLGETTLRMAMEGRIILVHLMCKDGNAIEEPKIFTPCIGFRVAGNPSVKEMMFATDVHLKEEYGGGLSVREYVAIGVCSLLLAVVYVAAVALYLYIRKRKKKKNASKKSGKSATLTLGEEGVIKNNPLLQAARHLSSGGHVNGGYVSESNSCCSDTEQTSDLLCLDDDDDDLVGPQNMETAAIIHPCDLEYGETTVSQDPNNREKLPEENVSIVETLESREHPETVKGMGCGNGRRKLYFNPSYFEPDLLKAPPPAAMEFLIKIREVIAIAKHKMSAKKFSPSLLGIPEEDSTSKAECNSSLNARRNSPVTTEQPSEFPELPGELCWPPDSKQKIIRKWLEDVPVMTLEQDDCRVQKIVSQESKILNNLKLWQTNEMNSEIERVSSPPLRPEKRRAKGRAPPVPPLKASVQPENLGLEVAAPPRPPPMPVFKHGSNEVLRVQGKDCIPPIIAKNLMDAVIQELTTFKKHENDSKLKELPKKINDTLDEKKENIKAEAELKKEREEEGSTPPIVGENGLPEEPEVSKNKNAMSSAPPDDHEYEIILLNPDQPTHKDKQMKIYNLPELLSKSDRSEGYSLVSEVYVNDGYSCCSGESPPSSFSNLSFDSDNVHYDVPNENPGRLTIHVSDSPERYKTLASDSDYFEPDTLDRKPKRARGVNGCQGKVNDGERYSNQKFHHTECYLISNNNSDKFTDSLERPRIMLKTNGTFKRNSLENNADDLLRNFSWNKMEGFGSLREIYEAKSRNYKRRETTSLIDCSHNDQDTNDRTSTLSWNEERRNKLLHRGIVLHINDEGSRRYKRTTRRDTRPADSPKGPFRFPKLSPGHHCSPSSTSPTPSDRASPVPRYPLSPRTVSPPLPPPRSVPPSPPPRSISSPSPTSQPQSRSTPSSPKPCTSPFSRSPSPPTRFPHLLSLSPPPRPPKIVNNNPLLPPRNTKPPLPPKNLRPPKPGKFASRPLPPLPRPTMNHFTASPLPFRDPDALSTFSGASNDSLNSSDYEAFYTLPYTDNEQAGIGGAPDSPKKPKHPASSHRLCTRAQISSDPQRPRPHRTEDSGYLSTDSDSCCPPLAFPAPFAKIPESSAQNSETDESLCDGASESGAESIATDSFFYGDFHSRPERTSEDVDDGEIGEEQRPCALGLSDVEVNSDTDLHCVPIMVRP